MAERTTKYYLFSQIRIGGVPVSRLKPFNPTTLNEPQMGFAYTHGDKRRVTVSLVPNAPDTVHIAPVEQHLKPFPARGRTLDAADVQLATVLPMVRRHIVVRRNIAA